MRQIHTLENKGPEILKVERISTVRKMKRNKESTPHWVVTQMLSALECFGIDKITDVINERYNRSRIPEDLLKSIFLTLHKTLGANIWKLHRIISSMSHIRKLMMPTLMNRTWTELEIRKETCDLVKNTGKRNKVFMTKMISRCAIKTAEICARMFYRLRKNIWQGTALESILSAKMTICIFNLY